MSFSRQTIIISLSCLLASAVFAKEVDASSNLRKKRNLQFDFGSFLPDQQDSDSSGQGDGPLADLLDGLTNGFEMVDVAAIQAMDPLLLGDSDNRTFVVGTAITNCTGNITVTLDQGVLTGLSTLVMDRFELVPNTEQVQESGNWWSSLMTWSATFDILATADSLVLETGVTIVPAEDDQDCIPQEYAAEDGSFRTGIKVTMTNPVFEMMLNIGGNTPQGFIDGMFGDSQSVADSITTDSVSLNYDTWIVTFDNPNLNQTINMTEVIELAESFLQDAFNITDFDMEGLNGLDGFEGFEGLDNITNFLQEEIGVVSKRAGFSF